MSHQFKPGDLALIVGYKKSPVNLGKACELIAFLNPGERIDYPHSVFDGVRHIGQCPAWLVSGNGLINSTTGHSGHALVQAKNLMPLRGNFAPEQRKAREVTV